MDFRVTIKRKVEKSLKDLPEKVQVKFWVLIKELRLSGPIRRNWPNFSQLGKVTYHATSATTGSLVGAGKRQR